jgi:hypothetical protein
MKLKLIQLFALSIIFILNTATSCEDTYETIDIEVKEIKLYNINNEGARPLISDEPIKKEAYMIGISYIGEKEEETSNGYRYVIKEDFKSQIISCDKDINTQYPAGSDISKLFTKTNYKVFETNYSFVLREAIQAGVYTFKVVITTADDKVIEASTNPIELY